MVRLDQMWRGNSSAKSKNKLSKIVSIAGKVIDESQKHLCNIIVSAA